MRYVRKVTSIRIVNGNETREERIEESDTPFASPEWCELEAVWTDVDSSFKRIGESFARLGKSMGRLFA